MVVCKFYQQGNCRYGDNCKFEHPGAARNNNAGFASQNRYGAFQNAAGGSSGGSSNVRKDIPYNINIADVRNDLTPGKGRPQWILSAYGPGRAPPKSLFEDSEFSFEELRLRYYELAASGNQSQADQEASSLWSKCEAAIADVASRADNVIKFMEEAEKKHPNRLDFCKADGTKSRDQFARNLGPSNSLGSSAGDGQGRFGQPSKPDNPFSKPASTFGQPAAASGFASGGFGQPAPPSAFGQASGGFGQPLLSDANKTAFGQPSQPTSKFGQPSQPTSAFGQPAQPSAFGSTRLGPPPQTTTTFGQPSQPASTFGQPAQLGGTFGKPSQPTSIFGQPAQPSGFGTSPFGQPSQQTTSAFGQPAQLAANSPFGQPAQTSTTTAFGQPSQPATSSPFEPASQPVTTSAFGQASQPATTTLLGQPSQPTTATFGQPNQPNTASGFGQPSAPNPFEQSAKSQPSNPFDRKPAEPSVGLSQPQPDVTPNAAFGQPVLARTNPFNPPTPSAPSSTALKNTKSSTTPHPLTTRPPHPLHYTETLPLPDSNNTKTDPRTRKLILYRSCRVQYINDAPCYERPDRQGWERIWFVDGPTSGEVVALGKKDKVGDLVAKPELYTDQVKEEYQHLFENGKFNDGKMPTVPPLREWCVYDF